MEALRRLVVGDAALSNQLATLTDRDAFVAAVVSVAEAHEIALTPQDIVDALGREALAQQDRWE